MARTYPQRLPDTFISPAERKLFRILAEGLDDAYTIFYRVAWLSRQQGRARNGEADFIVAHPRRGLLVIEVKGGEVAFDGETNTWQSVSKHGKPHPIQDPFAQSRAALYLLREKLRDSKATRRYLYPIGYAVAFPDVLVREVALRLDAPAAIVLDAAALDSVEQWIEMAYDFWHGQGERGAPGQAAMEALVRLLAPTWQLRTPLRLAFEVEEERIRQLTEQQFALLDFLARHRRAKVCGCAGSGKTFLAVEKARRLAAEGFSVLFTCFNRNLADWIARSLPPESGVVVRHFHRLCHEMAAQAGLLSSEQVRPDVLPGLLGQAARHLPEARFDAIIADEGQDFQSDWWEMLARLLRDPDEGILYVFYDDNQRIYQPVSLYPIAGEPFILSHNCRNTQRIHQTVMGYYRGESVPGCLGPEGRSVEFIPVPGRQDEPRVLGHLLTRLTQGEGVPLTSIVLLTPCSQRRSRWLDGLPVGGVTLAWQVEPPPDTLAVSTIHAFKGLERPVVILTELDRITAGDRESLLYVALSRARNHVILLGEAGTAAV